MRTAVVFESMFGQTRQLAEAIADGLAAFGPVRVLSVNDVDSGDAAGAADLLVIGGPTHVHGMSRPESRVEAAKWADDPSKNLTLEPGTPGLGMREWLAGLTSSPALFAAFATRADMARILSGDASRRIGHELVKRGSRAPYPAADFLVSRQNELMPGEVDRARAWGRDVGAACAPSG